MSDAAEELLSSQAREIAQSEAARARDMDPGGLDAAMRRAWPVLADFRRGRSLMWEWIGKLEAVKESA